MHNIQIYMTLLLKLFNSFSGKPIRFGYKNWILTSNDGYQYQIIQYQGKAMCTDCGHFSPRVINSLLKVVENPPCHEVFFDNYFTSVGFLKSLCAQGIKATGTIRVELTDWITPLCLLLNLWRRKPAALCKFTLQIFLLFVWSIIKW